LNGVGYIRLLYKELRNSVNNTRRPFVRADDRLTYNTQDNAVRKLQSRRRHQRRDYHRRRHYTAAVNGSTEFTPLYTDSDEYGEMEGWVAEQYF